MLMTEAEKDNPEDEHLDEKHKIEERIKQREEEVCDLFYVFDSDISDYVVSCKHQVFKIFAYLT